MAYSLVASNSITVGSGTTAGFDAWFDGGSHYFSISPQTMSANVNWITPASASDGFLLGTTSSTTNSTLSYVGFSGSGNVARVTSPTFVTPTLGAATATTINKVTITAPATGATLTIADGKTATINNSITLAGTDSTTITLPAATATVFSTAAGEINSLTAKTTPASSDLVLIEDSAASNAKKKMTYANFTSGLGGGSTIGYQLKFGGADTSSNPANGGFTYYSGGTVYSVPTTSFTNQCVPIFKTGTIKGIGVRVRVDGTLGSSENVTFKVSINGAAGSGTGVIMPLSAINNLGTSTGESIAITAGQTIALTWTTPTWATPPTTCYFESWVYIE
jgi:hypothetical protein